ncbi:MAG TPA: urate hydroxylase PuuD [Gaiellaceae bacterium]|nr:urate hydroxylase PuuD [Gaiellaceae bacterium]
MAAALIDAYWHDWLDLLIRWLHVIAGIVWIGTSFYFVALDNHLGRPREQRDVDDGVAGESWEIHGGGFYRVSKWTVAPRELPEPLHWFKWEAYTTWLSGFALLVVLYYFQADTYLIDPSVRDISEGAAVTLSLLGLGAAWVLYDLACRILRIEALLGVFMLGLVAASAYAASQVFSGRAAYLQVGAMLGTIMAANVLFVIIPAHWDLIRAKQAGERPDPAPALEAKRRSVHNNYLTLPVVFTMISNHFPFTYGHDHGWLVLVALVVIGAWVRHFFNLRHAGRNAWWIPVTAAAAVVALAIAIRPDDGAGGDGPARAVSVEEAQAIVEQRCVPCHSQEPTQEGFDSPPAGVAFDTIGEIESRADRIEAQAVDTTAMPPGNVTGMTDDERETLGAWIDSLK